MHRNRLFNRVGGAVCPRCNALLCFADGIYCAQIERFASGIAGSHLRSLTGWTKQRKPGFAFDLEVHCLSLRQVVTHDHRQANLITLSQNSWWIVLNKERLKCLDLFFDNADLTIFGRANHRHLPRRYVVSKLEVQLRPTLLVSLERWLPNQRLGKVFAQPWRCRALT